MIARAAWRVSVALVAAGVVGNLAAALLEVIA